MGEPGMTQNELWDVLIIGAGVPGWAVAWC